ncbi:hypothetical protein [Vibrio owensii]|uniref:hypothetical protein n=1 Tax=Vibrio owensii TaxID=696485 RepID=UPI003CC5A112
MTKKFTLYASELDLEFESKRQFASLKEAQDWLKKNAENEMLFSDDLRIVNNFAKPGEKHLIGVSSDFSLHPLNILKPESEMALPQIEDNMRIEEKVQENYHGPIKTVFIDFVDRDTYRSISSTLHDTYFNPSYIRSETLPEPAYESNEIMMVIRNSTSDVIGLCNFTRSQRQIDFFDSNDKTCDYQCKLEFVYLTDEYRGLGYGAAIRRAIGQIVEQDVESVADAINESGATQNVQFLCEPITPQGFHFSEALSSDIAYVSEKVIEANMERESQAHHRKLPAFESTIDY